MREIVDDYSNLEDELKFEQVTVYSMKLNFNNSYHGKVGGE